MNPRLKALLAQKQAYISEAKTLNEKADWTSDDETRATELKGLIAASDQAIAEAQDFSDSVQKADALLNGGKFSPAAAATVIGDIAAEAAASRYRGRIRNFTGTPEQQARKAYRFGMWLMATKGNPQALAYCAQNGLPVTHFAAPGASFGAPQFNSTVLGASEGINEDGGYLVPPEFESDMIVLREMFGVFRKFARNQPMGSDTTSRLRRRSGLTAYFVGEGTAAAASKKGWDRVVLTAQNAMVLSYVTSQVNEDSIINMGDDLAGEISYAFAALEDDCGFNGDGTSTYGKMTGVRQRLYDVYGAGGGVGLVLGSGSVGSGTLWQELTLADFNKVSGALPQYADTPNAAWYCHKVFYHDVMERLMLAAGGVTAAEVAAGRRTPIFMGYPVNISQKMPKTETVSQVPVVFGDLGLAADFGDRRQTTIRFSDQFAFDTDQIAIKGTERFDINVHDVGDATNAGPVVGLVTAAS